jgi:hypothetical protein
VDYLIKREDALQAREGILASAEAQWQAMQLGRSEEDLKATLDKLVSQVNQGDRGGTLNILLRMVKGLDPDAASPQIINPRTRVAGGSTALKAGAVQTRADRSKSPQRSPPGGRQLRSRSRLSFFDKVSGKKSDSPPSPEEPKKFATMGRKTLGLTKDESGKRRFSIPKLFRRELRSTSGSNVQPPRTPRVRQRDEDNDEDAGATALSPSEGAHARSKSKSTKKGADEALVQQRLNTLQGEQAPQFGRLPGGPRPPPRRHGPGYGGIEDVFSIPISPPRRSREEVSDSQEEDEAGMSE